MTRRKVTKSAVNGRFVAKAEAVEHPETTITQTVRVGEAEVTEAMLTAGAKPLRKLLTSKTATVDGALIDIYRAMRALEPE